MLLQRTHEGAKVPASAGPSLNKAGTRCRLDLTALRGAPQESWMELSLQKAAPASATSSVLRPIGVRPAAACAGGTSGMDGICAITTLVGIDPAAMPPKQAQQQQQRCCAHLGVERHQEVMGVRRERVGRQVPSWHKVDASVGQATASLRLLHSLSQHPKPMDHCFAHNVVFERYSYCSGPFARRFGVLAQNRTVEPRRENARAPQRFERPSALL